MSKDKKSIDAGMQNAIAGSEKEGSPSDSTAKTRALVRRRVHEEIADSLPRLAEDPEIERRDQEVKDIWRNLLLRKQTKEELEKNMEKSKTQSKEIKSSLGDSKKKVNALLVGQKNSEVALRASQEKIAFIKKRLQEKLDDA